jgi:hypothetical protein
VLALQTSSTLGSGLAVPGPEELPAGAAVNVCWAAGLVQPTMARMRAVPNKDARRKG